MVLGTDSHVSPYVTYKNWPFLPFLGSRRGWLRYLCLLRGFKTPLKMHPIKTTFLQPRGEGRAAGCRKAGAASSYSPLLRGDVWLPLAPPKHSPGALLSLSMLGGDGGFRGPTPVAATGPQREAGVGDSRPPLSPSPLQSSQRDRRPLRCAPGEEEALDPWPRV